MTIILILFFGGLLLWLLFRNSEEKEAQKQQAQAQAYQKAQEDYAAAKREARDAYYKMAVEKYTKLGLADLLPHMVILDPDESGDIMIKWVDLNDEQRERLYQKIYEDEDSRLEDFK